MFSEQVKAGMIRGLIIGVLIGALTTLTTWTQTDDAKTLIIAGGTAFITTFLARSGLEGGYDQRRQENQDLRPSDVHSTDKPAPPGPAPTPQPPTPSPVGP